MVGGSRCCRRHKTAKGGSVVADHGEGHAGLRELKREINIHTRNTTHTLVHNYTHTQNERMINTHTFHFNTTIKRACYQ